MQGLKGTRLCDGAGLEDDAVGVATGMDGERGHRICASLASVDPRIGKYSADSADQSIRSIQFLLWMRDSSDELDGYN